MNKTLLTHFLNWSYLKKHKKIYNYELACGCCWSFGGLIKLVWKELDGSKNLFENPGGEIRGTGEFCWSEDPPPLLLFPVFTNFFNEFTKYERFADFGSLLSFAAFWCSDEEEEDLLINFVKKSSGLGPPLLWGDSLLVFVVAFKLGEFSSSRTGVEGELLLLLSIYM